LLIQIQILNGINQSIIVVTHIIIVNQIQNTVLDMVLGSGVHEIVSDGVNLIFGVGIVVFVIECKHEWRSEETG
jgi:hypothetical protein